MDYFKHYERLINRSKSRIIDGYTETHHIIPRCMGGSDDPENLVNLTPEEHYVAHQLLCKCYPNNTKLINAAIMMIPKRPSNKLYGWLRRRFSENQSVRQQGTNNTQFGTRWIHNLSLKKSKKINKNDKLPEGWIEGRIMDFNTLDECPVCDSLKPKRNQTCSKQCLNEKKKNEEREKANELFQMFLNSDFNSIRKFAESMNITQAGLSMRWKKYVPAYNEMKKPGKSFKI